jgi:hypothetical protein
MPSDSDSKKKQVNTLLNADDGEVLEAVAFLRSVPLSEVARDVLVKFAEAERSKPRVRTVVEQRRAEKAEQESVSSVSSITDARSTREKRARRSHPR